MKRSASIILALAAFLSLPSQAQTPPSMTRVQGAFVSLNGQTLSIKDRDGKTVIFTLPPETKVVLSTPATLADIKPGDFVGSAAVQRADGKLHAQEVHIMSGDLRGQGEGHRPMAAPETSMTNATVTDVEGAATSADGRILKMQYQGGTAEILVSPSVPVVMLRSAELSVLHPGASIAVTSNNGQVRFVTMDQDK